MSQSTRILLVVVGLGIATVITVSMSQVGASLARISSDVSEFRSELTGTLEWAIDQRLDAGYQDPVLNPEDPLLQDRKILLTHEINTRSAKDVTARLLYLNSVDSETPIDLYLSTPGGWLNNAFAIIDVMRLIDAPVNTWALGECFSAGAVILAAGTGRRYATENTIVMVHTNRTDSTEEYSYDRLDLALFEKLWKTTAELPEEWYPMTSDGTYHLTAEQAREFKIVDEVVGASESP